MKKVISFSFNICLWKLTHGNLSLPSAIDQYFFFFFFFSFVFLSTYCFVCSFSLDNWTTIIIIIHRRQSPKTVEQRSEKKRDTKNKSSSTSCVRAFVFSRILLANVKVCFFCFSDQTLDARRRSSIRTSLLDFNGKKWHLTRMNSYSWIRESSRAQDDVCLPPVVIYLFVFSSPSSSSFCSGRSRWETVENRRKRTDFKMIDSLRQDV